MQSVQNKEESEEKKTKKLFKNLLAHISGLVGVICFKFGM